MLLSDLLTTGWRKTWLLILFTHCSGVAALRTKWHLQFCLLAVPHVYVVCAINTLEINCVQTQWQYFLLLPLFEESSLICIIILSFPSFSLSLRMEGSILAAPFPRLLSALMMARVYLDQWSFVCVFLTRHLFLLSFARGLLWLIGKNKRGKANIRRHAVIRAEN